MKKKLSLIFLILIVMSSVAFAQTDEKKETPEAYKFFEFGKISDKLLKEKLQVFCSEIDKTNWIGWIISYGTSNEIVKRENRLKKSLRYNCFQEFPTPRMIIVNGGESEESKTILWIVPPGAEPPMP